jgi:eukaryotic-like serine/threonine-protein kinase
MTPERWQQVKDLLGQALQIPPEERGAFLDGVCSSDQELRAEIVSLLSEQEVVQSKFLQSPPLVKDTGNNGDESREPDGALRAGLIFAERFELIRKLGEGGMGQVWLAEQIAPVRRQVALKLIKAGMYDESVVKRFRAERQSLAIMDHPAIAKVFDAGATPQGQPFFVMEYVPGLPITQYCDEKKLKIADRLELFIQTCEGVQHAHQKAIIHRDLKPANILVVELDGKPVPRIIDFGLAKAAATQAGETFFTQVGHLVGTPGYMSPEQADPDAKDIDTRTDVYSLGAVLYVLLAGSQPFDAKPGEKLPLDELLRKLREEEPPSPSTRVSGDGERSKATADARGTDFKQLASLLRGDLDWITMKALEKDRARRYGTPSELAADIRRYLNHEAVSARPASAGYRLRKYVRRHRVTVAVAAGLVMLLAAFSILEALQLRRITLERNHANSERDRANNERDRATRITDFMTNMFKVSGPSEARGNSVTAREILDKASKDIATGLVKDPEAQSQMMQVMATTYEDLGLYARAHELAKPALDSRLSLLGPNDPKTLESMTEFAWILAREGHDEEAEKLDRQALESDRRILGPEDPLTLKAMDHLAVILQHQGHYAEEENLERQAIEIEIRRLGPDNAQTMRSMNNLGNALGLQARYVEAEQQYRKLLDVERRVLGADHPQTISAMSNLGLVILSQGRFAEAEPLCRELLSTERRVRGPESPGAANATGMLAGVLSGEGRLADSEKLFREQLGIWLRAVGPDHPETLLAKAELAELLLKEGQVREAEKMQREALATRVRVLPPGNPDIWESQSDLAAVLNREGHYAEAEKLAHEAFEGLIRILGPQQPYTLGALKQLGSAMAYQHHYGEASKVFRDVIEKEKSGGQGDSWSVWYAFACVAEAAGRQDDALQYLQEATNRGYKNADGLMADDDLKNLRSNPHFQELVTQLRRQTQSAGAH